MNKSQAKIILTQIVMNALRIQGYVLESAHATALERTGVIALSAIWVLKKDLAEVCERCLNFVNVI